MQTIRRSLIALLVLLSLPGTAFSQIQMRQGQVYRYPVPAGWTAQDSSNGIEMTAPDGSAGAYSMMLVDTSRLRSNREIAGMTAEGYGYQGTQLISADPSRDVAGTQGLIYKFRAHFHGLPVQCLMFVYVQNYYGATYAHVYGYHTTAQRWSQDQPILERMLANVQVINNAGVAQQANLIQPVNRPFDATYKSGQDAWANRQKTYDKTSQWQRESTMGEVRNKDPQTGKVYTSPVQTYDGTVGGYRNPTPGRMNEVLQHAAPGE